jgi:hypothetical protein
MPYHPTSKIPYFKIDKTVKSDKVTYHLKTNSSIMFEKLRPLAILGTIASVSPACTAEVGAEGGDTVVEIPEYCADSNDTEVKPSGKPAAKVYGQPCLDPEFRAAYTAQITEDVALSVRILYYDGVPIENIREGIKRDIKSLNGAFLPTGLKFFVGRIEEVKDNSIKDLLKEPVSIQRCLDVSNYFNAKGYEQHQDSISVEYVPKCNNDMDGITPYGIPSSTMFYQHPINHFPSDQLFPAEPGHVSHAYYLAHEIGHTYGLAHTFQLPDIGDGIDATADYFRSCSENPEEYPDNDYHIEKFNRGGVCMVRCAGGCFEAPSNLMDYNFCSGNLPSTLVPEQVDVIKCTILSNSEQVAGSRFDAGIDSGLSEVEF